MKIIQKLLFAVFTALFQLSQVFAAPTGSSETSPPSSFGSQSDSEPLPQLTVVDSYDVNLSATLYGLVNTIQTDVTLQEGFIKWNEYLKEYVREKIPNIKPNRAIRDYLTRVEHWAPRRLILQFKQGCVIAQYNRRLVSMRHRQPHNMTDDQCREMAYDVLGKVMDDKYKAMENDCRAHGLVNEITTLAQFRINKFLIFKTIGEHEHKFFDVEKVSRTPEKEREASLVAIKYVKEHFEALPCPYQFEVVYL